MRGWEITEDWWRHSIPFLDKHFDDIQNGQSYLHNVPQKLYGQQI